MKKFEEFINEQDQKSIERLNQLKYISTWIEKKFLPMFEDFNKFPYVNAEKYFIDDPSLLMTSNNIENFKVKVKFSDFDDEDPDSLILDHVIDWYSNIKEGTKDIVEEVRLDSKYRTELKFIIKYEKIYDPNLFKSWIAVDKYKL